jgi:chromosome segregation ATPase
MRMSFRDDMVIIDRELQAKAKAFLDSQNDNQALAKTIINMESAVKQARDGEEKSSALLEEARAAIKIERQKIKDREEAIAKERDELDRKRTDANSSVLNHRKDKEQAQYELEEARVTTGVQKERIGKLEEHTRKLAADNETFRISISDLEAQVEKARTDAGKAEEHLRRELELAQSDVDELSDLIKTKDRMLEDQNIVIAELKEKIKERDEEIKQNADSKGKYRDFYEDKLQQEYEESEKLRAAKEDAIAELNQLYADFDALKAENSRLTERHAQAQQQLDDKGAVIDFVEVEIQKIKDERDGERLEKEEKEQQLEHLQGQIYERDNQVDVKTEEIKILLERMEDYRKSKDREVEKLRD